MDLDLVRLGVDKDVSAVVDESPFNESMLSLLVLREMEDTSPVIIGEN